MKILFTGASSFTGHWFVRELAAAGHEVTATFQRRREEYEGIRRRRVDGLLDVCSTRFECTFGADGFMKLIRGEPRWDILCHHAADVTDYKSPDFNVIGALASNTRNLAAVMNELGARGCRRLLLTGSVFEAGEGAGSEGLPAFSPYGVSKELTSRVAGFEAHRRGWHFGKFVVPNPFGPLEEPRFTAYLMRAWASRKAATVNTPDYVRDNIHVDLLARAYRQFAETLPRTRGFSRSSPSGYVESQGRFAERFATEMRSRLSLPCELRLEAQATFDEPRMRVNTDPAAAAAGWNEDEAWARLADYYAGELGIGTRDVGYG